MPRKHAHGHGTRHLKMAKNHCFACGKDNPDGMHLKFFLDEPRQRFVANIRLARRYEGPPGHAHGGIVATVLDEAMGKVNKLRSAVALTSQMKVEYFKPVPLRQPLRVESYEVRHRGRRHTNAAEIRNRNGELLARSTGVFIALDPARLAAKFGKHLRKD
jgi:uncharacterized protein (TIGR00369 family)